MRWLIHCSRYNRTSNPYQFVEGTYKLVLPEVSKITAPKPAEAKSEWEKFLGTYAADWGDSEVIIRGGQLQMVSVAFFDESPTILEPTDQPNVFTLKQTGNPRETARFELNGDGKVTRLWLRGEYAVPKRS
jgi:hypothetical protein